MPKGPLSPSRSRIRTDLESAHATWVPDADIRRSAPPSWEMVKTPCWLRTKASCVHQGTRPGWSLSLAIPSIAEALHSRRLSHRYPSWRSRRRLTTRTRRGRRQGTTLAALPRPVRSQRMQVGWRDHRSGRAPGQRGGNDAAMTARTLATIHGAEVRNRRSLSRLRRDNL